MAAYAVKRRPDWVREWPAMVVLAVSGIFWSKECEEAISGRCMCCLEPCTKLALPPCMHQSAFCRSSMRCLSISSWLPILIYRMHTVHAGGTIEGYFQKCNQDLLDLTDLVRGKLSGQDRLTLGALITIDVHARDVVQVCGFISACPAWLAPASLSMVCPLKRAQSCGT